MARQCLITSILSIFLLTTSIIGISYLGNTELVVDDSGLVVINNNVGIGTANPTAKLTVMGETYFNGPVGHGQEIALTNTGNVNWLRGRNQRININTTSRLTMSFTDPPEGTKLTLIFDYQAANIPTVNWTNVSIKWPGTQSNIIPTVNKTDILNMLYISGAYHVFPEIRYD